MVAAAKRNSRAALAARVLAALVAVLTTALPAPCQAQTVPAPAPEDVTFLLGRVTLFPAFTLRDIGFDSNVLNDPDNPKSDFTLTAQPRLRAAVPAAGGLLSGGATVGSSTTLPTRISSRSTGSSRAASKARRRGCGRSWPARSTTRATARAGDRCPGRASRNQCLWRRGTQADGHHVAHRALPSLDPELRRR